MPKFTVTDEAMDVLAKAPSEERVKFLDSLAPEERQQIADYAPSWKQRRAQPQAAPPQTAPTPPQPLAAPPQTAEPGMWDKINAFKDQHIVPVADAINQHVVKPLQENVGRPFVNAGVGVVNKVGGAIGNNYSDLAANELLTRKAFSPLTGQSAEEGMGADKALVGQKTLEKELGQTGAAVANKVAEFIPDAAALAAPLPGAKIRAVLEGAKWVEKAPLVAHVLHAAISGAVDLGLIEGGKAAVTKGAKIQDATLEGMKTGAIAGPALELGAKAVGKVIGKVADLIPRKKVGELTEGGANQFAEEISGHVQKHSEEVKDVTKIDPTFAQVTRNKDGQIVARLHEINADGSSKFHDLQLNNEEQALKLQALRQKGYEKRPSEVLHSDEFGDVETGKNQYKIQISVDKDLVPELHADGRLQEILRAHPDALKPKSIEEKTFSGRTPKAGPNGTRATGVSGRDVENTQRIMESTDEAPTDGSLPASDVSVDAKGKIKLEPKSELPTGSDLTNPGRRLGAGGGNGGKPPPPPDPPSSVDAEPEPEPISPPVPDKPITEGDIPAHQAISAQAVAKLTKDSVFKKPGLLDRTLKAAVGSVHRGPQYLRELQLNLLGAKALNRADEVMAGFRARLPSKSLTGQAQDMLSSVAQGKIPFAKLEEAHPEMAAHIKEFSAALIKEKDQLSQDIARLLPGRKGIAALEKEIGREGDMEKYLATVYRAHLFPKGEWAKLAPEHVMQDAADFLIKEHQTLNLPVSETAIKQELLDLLNAPDPEAAFKASPLAAPFKGLIAKQYLPPPLRRLLGEESSGAIRIAFSLAKQRSIKETLGVWKELSQSSEWFSKVPTEELSAKIPDIPEMFGFAAGGYTHPSMSSMLNPKQVAQAVDGFTSFMRATQRFVKRNQTIYNPGYWQKNIIMNLKNGGIHGSFDFLRPLQTGRAMRDAFLGMYEWYFKKNVSPLLGPKAKLFYHFRSSGGGLPGFAQTELEPEMRSVMREIASAVGSPKAPMDIWGMLKNVANRTEGWTAQKFGHLSDMSDQWFRFNGWLNARERAIPRLAKEFHLPPTHEAVIKQAEREAARRVAENFPTYHNVGTAVEGLRKSALGSTAPFLTANMEDLRINAMLAQRIAKGDKQTISSLIQFGVLTAAVIGGFKAMRRNNGITDDEADATYRSIPDRLKTYHSLFALPWRDKEKRLQFWDASWFLPELGYLQGNPNDKWTRRVAANLMLSITQGGFAEEPGRRMLEQFGVISPGPKPPELIEGEGGLAKGANQLWQTGLLGPTGIYRGYDALRKGGLVDHQSRYAEVLTPGGVAQRAAGLPLVTQATPPNVSGSKTASNSAMESVFKIQDLITQLKRVETSTRPDAQKAALAESIKAAIIQEKNKMAERRAATAKIK